ncbi:MAG: hypothetical protein K2Y37_08815 [Pirellulales bacterium]|nr:hypothetical protein [Pirellulales bacterium]
MSATTSTEVVANSALVRDDLLALVERRALYVGAGAAVICALGWLIDSAGFYRAYLWGYVYWLNIALGLVGWLLLQNLAGGRWSVAIIDVLSSGARTLKWLAQLFLPIALGIPSLYRWAQPAEVAASELLQHKQPYLNTSFFLGRAAGYFALWIVLAWLLNRWAVPLAQRGDDDTTRRIQRTGAIGLIAVAVTVSLAMVDWIMSLEPEWYSTIYGLIFVAGDMLAGMAFALLLSGFQDRRAQLVAPPGTAAAPLVRPDQYNDLGNLMLASVMAWAYLVFSQYLINYSGNTLEEIPWHLRRTRGAWGAVAILLIVFHFALPFVLLLIRDIKRDASRLAAVAGLVLVVQLLALAWIVKPAFGAGQGFSWLDPFALSAVGGLWLSRFLGQYRRQLALTRGDSPAFSSEAQP